jgi:hypothetical protein
MGTSNPRYRLRPLLAAPLVVLMSVQRGITGETLIALQIHTFCVAGT